MDLCFVVMWLLVAAEHVLRVKLTLPSLHTEIGLAVTMLIGQRLLCTQIPELQGNNKTKPSREARPFPSALPPPTVPDLFKRRIFPWVSLPPLELVLFSGLGVGLQKCILFTGQRTEHIYNITSLLGIYI